ncbi:MAG TPA: glycosyltransferase family 39 protein [Vicinamibacterales bacterium]|nr:glycosyltransferase family 39 protein [Vicinamibacterales bacterium]
MDSDRLQNRWDDGRSVIPSSRRVPSAAVAADVASLALAVLGLMAFAYGPLRLSLAGLRVSIGSPVRPFLFAAIVVAARHRLVPRHPRLEQLARWAAVHAQPDEAALFTARAWFGPRLRELALVAAGFTALVIAATWPQIRRFDAVPDIGDPLFSIWRIAWIAHQLPRDPRHLFDANAFYPERFTLTFSDSVIVPGLMTAPFFWLGVHPLVIYTGLILATFVLSSIAMYLFVRALTGRADAAAVAGIVFGLYLFRLPHYGHLELLMTMWMPLVLWGLHRTLARGRLRDGAATGIAFALQMLSSLYYGLFLAVYLVPLAAVLWLVRQRPWRAVGSLAAGAAIAGALVAPVAYEYIVSKPVRGERTAEVVESYSAAPQDYLQPHFRSRIYGAWSAAARTERELLPGLVPVALTIIALWPPLRPIRVAYGLALLVAFFASLGANGPIYMLLYDHVGAFRSLRVPPRFGMLVGLSLAVLAGYGAARIIDRWPRRRRLATALIVAVAVIEPWPKLELESVWHAPPPIYDRVPESAVVAEFPLPSDWLAFDTRYQYFSTFHWHRMVNGYSGYMPNSYGELLARARGFPSEAAIDYLRSRGVDHIAVHGAFYEPDRYRRIIAALDARKDIALIDSAKWEASESRMYRFR